MAITIRAPALVKASQSSHYAAEPMDIDSDSDGGAHLSSAPPAKRRKHDASKLVTPGEIVTEDPQWMR